MLLRYFYDDDLAQASYLVACQATGQALVIDPNRDIGVYREAAERDGVQIAHVTETHIHADFVSGSRELAAVTGAQIHLSDEGGDAWAYRFPHSPLHDGSVIRLGQVRIDVLHTPGHTPEHLTFLLTDEAGADAAMGAFTGDFVFVGDVGRPDLLEEAAGQRGTSKPAARDLFASLQRLATLPDYLQIWPGHGAGSACGKALGAVPTTTLGYERRFNWAFQIHDEAEFVRSVLEDQPVPPRYFAQMKRVNRDGPAMLADLVPPPRLEPSQLDAVLASDAIVLDARPQANYVRGHVPGTLGVSYPGDFTAYAGSVLPYDRDVYVIAGDDVVSDVIRALHRIGIDRIGGTWDDTAVAIRGSRLEPLPEVDVRAAASLLSHNGATLLDVRQPTEHRDVRIDGATNVPLQSLSQRLADVPRGRPLLVHCRTGHRSAVATSLLESRGFTDVVNVAGGITTWQAAGLPVRRGSDEHGPDGGISGRDT